MYYCSLIYEPCLHKHACFFISPAMSQNLSASLEISLSHQAVYQYLLDNLVSGPSFVPTVIAALHPSNKILHWEITSIKAGTKSLFLSLILILYLLTHTLPVPLYHIKTWASRIYLAGLFIVVIGFLLLSFRPHASLMNIVNLGTPYCLVPCTGIPRE